MFQMLQIPIPTTMAPPPDRALQGCALLRPSGLNPYNPWRKFQTMLLSEFDCLKKSTLASVDRDQH
ncbi:hypothetical protein A0256_24265 [Mucilaginibacter sp. PAMC 26640]|nr:hypothetical protein A0256_24265 [Mucilaginibacter sp. PAMC 26640]